jgi:protein ImuA
MPWAPGRQLAFPSPEPELPADAASPPAEGPSLDTLHPALWRGHQLGRQVDHTVPSGFAALDAHLPGGGWPRRALTELLLPQPGIGEIRLLADCLAQVQRSGRLVMLFDPPAQLSAWAVAQLGLDVQQLLIVNTRLQPVPGTDSLWALEQALKSGHVGAVMAWLPVRLRPERLRRLQLAAHVHDGPAFMLREMAAQQQPSAAPLRLALRPGGPDQLAVNVLKRKGPPLKVPVHLSLPPVLSEAALARAHDALAQDALNEAGALGRLSGATFVNLA